MGKRNGEKNIAVSILTNKGDNKDNDNKEENERDSGAEIVSPNCSIDIKHPTEILLVGI